MINPASSPSYRPMYGTLAGASRADSTANQTALDLVTALPIFAVGALAGLPVRGLGKYFVGELLLVGLAPLATPLLFGLKGTYGRVARLLFVSMFVTLVGYVGSDMIRDTASRDYLRGWSRWIFTAATFSSLAWLGSRNIRYVMVFILGWTIGMSAAPFLTGQAALGVRYMWKFFAAMPCCLSMLYLLRRYHPSLAVASTLLFALGSALLDYRTPAFMCALVFGVSLFAIRNKRRLEAGKKVSMSTFVAAMLVAASCAAMGYVAVQYLGERYGYAERFERSNQKRLANIEIALQAIGRSPWLGYGSWPRDPEFAKVRDKLVKKRIGSNIQRGEGQEDLIITHSQILQSWVEGGLLGLTFFLVSGVCMARALIWQAGEGPYLPLTPVMTAIVLFNSWHFFFSPFSADNRIFVPIACVTVCYMLQLKHDLKQQTRGHATPT